MPTLFPTIPTLRWGPSATQVAAILRHPIRDPGGNPWLLYRHGGGAIIRDYRLPFIANANGNSIFHHLSAMRSGVSDLHFDCISVDTRQTRWDTPIDQHEQNDKYRWVDNPIERGISFPHNLDEMKLCILALKSRAVELGIHPERGITMGTSYGSLAAVWPNMTEPLRTDDLPISMQHRYGLRSGFESRTCGTIMHQGLVDVSSTFQWNPVTLTTDGLTYADATKRLTGATGCFGTWDHLVANGVVTVTGGTGANTGVYEVAYVDPARTFIELRQSLGSAADAQTNLAITWRGYRPPIDLSSATFTNATKTLTKTNAFQTWAHKGDLLQITSGTGVTAGQYRVASRTSKDAIVLVADMGGTNPSDVGGYFNGDGLYYSWLYSLFGTWTKAEWDRIPRHQRDACSIQRRIMLGETKWLKPTLVWSETAGDHIRPFGGLGAGSDPHDSAQGDILVNAALAAGLPPGFITRQIPASTTDSNIVERDAACSAVYEWMANTVTSAQVSPSTVSVGAGSTLRVI